MSNNNPSPFSEAVSIIAILSGLAALGCYTAGSQNASVLTPALLWLAGCIYDWFPAMNRLQTPQAPLLVASAAAGLLCFLALLPLAFWLGNECQLPGLGVWRTTTFAADIGYGHLRRRKLW